MRNSRGKRAGFFLIIVLVVVAIATMAVYSFTEFMLAQDEAAYLSSDQVQARVSAESAVELIRVFLSGPGEQRDASGGLYNNPNLFQAVPVNHDDAKLRPSSFTVLAPAIDVEGLTGGVRYGLQDESARLNVNALTLLENNSQLVLPFTIASSADDATSPQDAENIASTLLLSLPGMTTEIADSILDWIDEDDDPRSAGAEFDYYDTLPTPYAPANGPISSIDELLLVRGVTPSLLYGADVNRNGVVDVDEEQRFSVTSDTPGALGWAPYLTVNGIEANKTVSGQPRINVNQDDLNALSQQLQETNLDEIYTSFIVAYRISGQAQLGLPAGANDDDADSTDFEQPQSDNPPWSAQQLSELDLDGEGPVQINQLLDLIGATVTVGNGNTATTYQSPFVDNAGAYADYLADLMDSLTTQDSEIIPGRINLNECLPELLYGIPSLSDETIMAILEQRDPASNDLSRRSETWLLGEGLVTLAEMRTLTPLLCGGGDVFRAQIVGYLDRSGIAHRFDAMIDATTANPKLISLQNLTHLGRGFDLSVLGSRIAN